MKIRLYGMKPQTFQVSYFQIGCLNYISVFAKIQFFKISVILYFSIDLLFSFFSTESGQLFSAVSQPTCQKICPTVSYCMRLKQTRAIFEKLQKNLVTTAKKYKKNRSIFAPPSRFRTLLRNG